ncbi:MAG TPA: (2Fe-2S)-binding protein [Candidatus Aerophobetes bacterium]|uniref:(2Fe-2S)-binding protein n=1 Tax=Aerophobetes bacterium TaxID=2030807 RepID=A0A7V5HZ95_UNCAE|nr:(2Fe-2S)-binding protein [Candidatus Aerophobetes bacterium]
MERKVIICRCEEVTEEEIREAIRKFNLKTVDEVKRVTRAGMGLCQGRTCGPLIERIIAEENKKISKVQPFSKRPPVRPVKIGLLAGKEGEIN